MNLRTPLRANGLQTRVIAGAAILILIAAVISDRVANGFWTRNAFLANLVSSLVVVALSVAVVNEVLERRRRRRWSVLAQYVLLELVRTAHLTWTAPASEPQQPGRSAPGRLR